MILQLKGSKLFLGHFPLEPRFAQVRFDGLNVLFSLEQTVPQTWNKKREMKKSQRI